jgi:molecular chaperone GrpE
MNSKKDSKVEQLTQKIAELTEALQRERADAINVRRRSDEERARLWNFHKSSIISELLPVLDNFELSLKHVQKELINNDYIKGVRGIFKQFEDTLEKIGVKRIKTVGEHFDPNLHEAISMEEGDGHKEIVSEELQAGYILGDEVIRHAMVKVKAEK